MNLGVWCIKNNRVAFVAFLLIALAGVRAFFTTSRLQSPEFTIRTAMVISYFPGATPRKIEELVTDKLENKIQELSEVETITSESMTGVSMIFVDVSAKYKDSIDEVWTKLRNKMDDVRNELPEGVEGPFVDDEFGDVFPVVIALTGDGYTYREMKDLADDARDELLTLSRVAKVDLYGAQDERIFVEFSSVRLADFGYTPDHLADALSNQNVLQPGGQALVGSDLISLEASGEFKTVEDIRQVSLRVKGRAESVYLGDIATIRRGFVDPPSAMARFNSEEAIMLAVNMAKGERVTDMGEDVRQMMKKLESNWPIGINYNIFIYQPIYVTRAINEFMGNLGQAFVFVVIVMLLFAGLRTGLIAGSLVPMAMLMCLALMPFFDIKLQQVSIASLIIALGMLVDNGVVTSEEMLVRLSRGEDPFKAVGATVSQLWLPLLAASLTTICSFLPIALAKSDVAEFCLSLFQVVTITLLCSWILSITLIPMLCYYFLKPKTQKQSFDTGIYNVYRKLLLFTLKHRAVTLLVMLALLIGALYCFRFVPTIFFPPDSRELMLIDFRQPYGTDIRTTRDRVARLEQHLLSDTNVAEVGTFVGNGGPVWVLGLMAEQDNPNYAFLVVNTHTKQCVPDLMLRTRTYLKERFPDALYTVKELENGPAVGAPIQIRLSGKKIKSLYQMRDLVTAELGAIPGVVSIRDDWGEWIKKLDIQVNQEQAKHAGFTSSDVASSLKTQLSGLHATDLRDGKHMIPIEIRAQGAMRNDLAKLESVNIYSYFNMDSVPLQQIAQEHLTWQPSDIRRRNKVRTMTIKADLVSGTFASDVLAHLVPRLEELQASNAWIRGYEVELGGEDEESEKAMASIMDAVPLAMSILALVLISQFNSIRRPLIIAITIPPMFIGIVFGLLLTGQPFGFMAFLGMISLMGIIVNNAIMMIDRIELDRNSGLNVDEAIVVAAQKRLRPILMTAVTTVVGLIPLSLFGGRMWAPMANTLIFGLLFATILTLVLCPILYSLFFGARFKGFTWDPSLLSHSEE